MRDLVDAPAEVVAATQARYQELYARALVPAT